MWEGQWGRECKLVGPELGQWKGGEIARMLSSSGGGRGPRGGGGGDLPRQGRSPLPHPINLQI